MTGHNQVSPNGRPVKTLPNVAEDLTTKLLGQMLWHLHQHARLAGGVQIPSAPGLDDQIAFDSGIVRLMVQRLEAQGVVSVDPIDVSALQSQLQQWLDGQLQETKEKMLELLGEVTPAQSPQPQIDEKEVSQRLQQIEQANADLDRRRQETIKEEQRVRQLSTGLEAREGALRDRESNLKEKLGNLESDQRTVDQDWEQVEGLKEDLQRKLTEADTLYQNLLQYVPHLVQGLAPPKVEVPTIEIGDDEEKTTPDDRYTPRFSGGLTWDELSRNVSLRESLKALRSRFTEFRRRASKKPNNAQWRIQGLSWDHIDTLLAKASNVRHFKLMLSDCKRETASQQGG